MSYLVDAEAHAAWLYHRAGFELSAPPGPGALALALMGESAIERRALLSGVPFCVALAEDIARWHLAAIMDSPTPAMIEQLAHALVLPEPAVRVCGEILGMSAAEVAETFHVPEWVAARRMRRVLSPSRSGQHPSERRIPLDVSATKRRP